MAIKINGQDLLKRFINGQEIVRVYKNGGQIRPETVPPVSPLLCFTAEASDSSVTLSQGGGGTPQSMEISYNKSTWMDYTIGATISLSNVGDKVYIRNKAISLPSFLFPAFRFSIGGYVGASGDIGYLLCKTSTTEAPGTCYANLFSGCTGLTKAPQLPAMEVGSQSYAYMFSGCTSLANPPQLPATSLDFLCYNGMFSGCTGLTSAPQLPATSLAGNCYERMFSGCTSLIVPPQLPATSLAGSCYEDMFSGCTSLEKLPRLPATYLNAGCYSYMFSGCSSIHISETQGGDYQTSYRIPTTGTGEKEYGLREPTENMFASTGGTFTGTPSINTTYYTSNQVI